ncbi:hypothetical protein BA062_07705 [Prauserella flavalba]|uniref:Uncharacterized protein n=1 Tax=Prauserella flavalba TaxID=1477506 RepID=A0A318LSN8_9PSEU|nr:hypothetical protein BA062_07705 [Prauserella flavalba]
MKGFAAETAAAHPAAKNYWRRVSRYGQGVGIWHETYLVKAGEYETVYGNMPSCGLGTARGSTLRRAGDVGTAVGSAA